MSEKSYGQVAYEARNGNISYPWDKTQPNTREIYDTLAAAVIAEYERRREVEIAAMNARAKLEQDAMLKAISRTETGDDDPTETEIDDDPQPETQEQYEARLLRALRSFG